MADPLRLTVLTLFPEWFASPLDTALFGRARTAGLIDVRLVNPREAATDRHHTVDDRPYGGGPGMVMMPDPLLRTIREEAGRAPGGRLGKTLLMSASGRPFTQAMAAELAREPSLTFICGRYEGIDARLGALCADVADIVEVSVGNAVLNGGEAAAMMIMEAVTRLVPGFMGKEASGEEESFSAGLLEYPQFTRPETLEGVAVPAVLLGGNHGSIARWRREQSLATTLGRRPAMLNEARLTAKDREILRELPYEWKGRNLHCALIHHPVWLDRKKVGTTSLTNLDVHDIARCSCSYGLGSFTVVTPLQDQQAILDSLCAHWREGAGGAANPDRATAFARVHKAGTLQEAVEQLQARTGQRPLLVGTSARDEGDMLPGDILAALAERPVLLLFGTGHGLAPQVLETCEGVLRPLRFMNGYNHLPVRGAVAITLDRILGDFA